MDPNGQVMRRHLDLLFRRPMVERPDCLCQLDAGGPERGNGWDSLYFNMDNLDEAVAYAVIENMRGRKLYVGINPRKADCLGRSARSGDVAAAYWQFADLDDKAAVDAALISLPLACNLAVYTGTVPHTRAHFYWERVEPMKDLARWSQVQQGIATNLKGDPVTDARRIMRLAGSVSYPSALKDKRGYIEEMVTMGVADASD
jgi:hypothetical protein